MARGRQLYVYYKVPQAALAATAAAAQQLQQQLRDELPGLVTQLLRRPELRDGAATLMETYARPGGLSDSDEARIDELAARWLPGVARQAERFDALP